MANYFNDDFRDFIRALNKYEVEYILVAVWLLFCMVMSAQQVIWIYG